MNEPVILNVGDDRQIPDAARHDFEGQGATHVEAHNVYGMLMARASREALERWQPDKRPFNINAPPTPDRSATPRPGRATTFRPGIICGSA